MLKKDEMIAGAIVEVVKYHSGIEADNSDKTHILITAEGGSVLDGGWGVKIGTQLEIVAGPKRRHGINTVIVKFTDPKGEKRDGHVFWCELRASCKLVQAAPDTAAAPPAQKAKKAPGTFTEKQLARLPAMGYWIEIYQDKPLTFYCVMNGKVKYIHSSGDHGWGTLLWSCCPTVKQMKECRPGQSFEHFADHAAMLAAHPDVKSSARVKAPNDN